MSTGPVFIDANVLLESVLSGRPQAVVAQRYIDSHSVVLSPLSAHLLAYFGKKDGISLEVIIDLLKEHSFTALGEHEIMWAAQNRQGNDFEDALQVACAVMAGAHSFATFDRDLAGRYGKFIVMELLK